MRAVCIRSEISGVEPVGGVNGNTDESRSFLKRRVLVRRTGSKADYRLSDLYGGSIGATIRQSIF